MSQRVDVEVFDLGGEIAHGCTTEGDHCAVSVACQENFHRSGEKFTNCRVS